MTTVVMLPAPSCDPLPSHTPHPGWLRGAGCRVPTACDGRRARVRTRRTRRQPAPGPGFGFGGFFSHAARLPLAQSHPDPPLRPYREVDGLTRIPAPLLTFSAPPSTLLCPPAHPAAQCARARRSSRPHPQSASAAAKATTPPGAGTPFLPWPTSRVATRRTEEDRRSRGVGSRTGLEMPHAGRAMTRATRPEQ